MNQDKKIVGTGHNCMPNGCEGKLPWNREGDELDTKYMYGEYALPHTCFFSSCLIQFDCIIWFKQSTPAFTHLPHSINVLQDVWIFLFKRHSSVVVILCCALYMCEK